MLRNIADPYILKYKDVYYLYGTDDIEPDVNEGFKVYISDDLVNWSSPKGTLSSGRVLDRSTAYGSLGFWGAEVYERNSLFYLFYTANEHLSVAVSKSPLGPFLQEDKKPLLEEKAIDCHLFVDDDGSAYLYYVRFDNNSNDIYVEQMNDDWLSFKENTRKRVIWATEEWENADPNFSAWPVTEGPTMIKHKGLYYLFYTANHFLSPYYSVGYAVADSPFGPFKKMNDSPILKATDNLKGTGHCSFIEAPNNELYIIYHAHNRVGVPTPRKMCMDKCEFVSNENPELPDKLCVFGPTTNSQILNW